MQPERLTIYLPGRLIDAAQALAKRHGVASAQQYCEQILAQHLAQEIAKLPALIPGVGTTGRDSALTGDETLVDGAFLLEKPAPAAEDGPRGFQEVSNDPAYLAELASLRNAGAPPPSMILDDTTQLLFALDEEDFVRDRPAKSPAIGPGEVDPKPSPAAASPDWTEAADIVFRHTGLISEDGDGLLRRLRLAQPLDAPIVRELLDALGCLEASFIGERMLDRRLAFALHRLALESELILAQISPGPGDDPSTRDAVHRVEEAVDRVLSGEDIRYYAEEQG